jgi:acyl carrier protein
MGLDGVELILAIEDGFQIHITDEEAGAVSTVGDLHNLVVEKLKGEESKRCLTSAAFYRTRRGIVEALGVDRRQIRPSTPLPGLLPQEARRDKWRRIQGAMECKLPALQHSGSTQLTFLSSAVVLALGPGIYYHLGMGWLALLFVFGLIVGGFLIKASPALATEFPNNESTVGDLARDVLAANYARLAEQVGGWSKKETWETLCRLIVHQTGVKREDITPEARIVGDLGID